MRIAIIPVATVALLGLALSTASAAAPKGSGGAPPQTTHGNPHTTSRAPTKPSPHASTSPTPTASTPTTSSAGTSTLPNPIAQKLQGKPLGSRIETMLPAGMTLDTASAGFRNQGQFIAAVHVSQNLGIPFADLKAAMLGTPTTPALSLGQAIQQLKPFANAKTEAARGEAEAERELAHLDEPHPSTPSTSTPPTPSKKHGK